MIGRMVVPSVLLAGILHRAALRCGQNWMWDIPRSHPGGTRTFSYGCDYTNVKKNLLTPFNFNSLPHIDIILRSIFTLKYS